MNILKSRLGLTRESNIKNSCKKINRISHLGRIIDDCLGWSSVFSNPRLQMNLRRTDEHEEETSYEEKTSYEEETSYDISAHRNGFQ